MSEQQGPHIDFVMLAAVLGGAMKAGGFSQRQVAETIGESPSTITRVMQATPCDLGGYVAICGWLRLSLDTFLTRGDS